MTELLKPRILRHEIMEQDAGKTIKEYLMRKIGFSSKQLSRFKYRKDGILLNGEKRYVNAVLQEGDVLEIRLTQGGEPAEEDPCRPLSCQGHMSPPVTDGCRRSVIPVPGILTIHSPIRLRSIWAASDRSWMCV